MSKKKSVFGIACRFAAAVVVTGAKGAQKVQEFLESERAKKFFERVDAKGAEFEKLGRAKADEIKKELDGIVKEAAEKIDKMANQSASAIDQVIADFEKQFEEIRKKAQEGKNKPPTDKK